MDSRWDNIDTGVLHSIPSLLSDSLGGLFELLLGGLAVPVRLDDLEYKRSLFLHRARSFRFPIQNVSVGSGGKTYLLHGSALTDTWET